MRIVHLSTSDLAGGAARSAYLIHRALVVAGVDSQLFVSQKLSHDPTVTEIPLHFTRLRRGISKRVDQLPVRLYPQRRQEIFSPNLVANSTAQFIQAARPDVIHLHWVNHGFLPVAHLPRLGASLVWNLWDHWPFTGGCHYSEGCPAYKSACGFCPALGSSRAQDLSARVFSAKREHWRNLRLQLVAPSNWLAERARASALFRHHHCTVLPQAIDPEIFQPVPMDKARQQLNLNPAAMIVVLGAADLDEPRKGFALATAALTSFSLADPNASVVFCTFGQTNKKMPDRIGQIPVRHLGRLQNPSEVALALSAADVALVPSREDAGPQITPESLACGTPVVGFPVGVTADLVRHQANGFIAPAFDPAGLTAGLHWAAGCRGDPAVRAAARAAVMAQADIHAQVSRYLEIYDRARRDQSQ